MAADRDPLRAVAQYRVDRLLAEDGVTRAEQPSDGVPAVRHGIGTDAWAEEAIRRAIARGDFDHLPLAGKPIPGLTRHDPDIEVARWRARRQAATAGGAAPEAPRRPASWYRGQFLSRRRRASSPAGSSDAR